MEKIKIKVLLIMMILLFFGCNLFSIVDYNLSTVSILITYFTNLISDGRLFSVDIIIALVPVILLLFIYNFKKLFSTFILCCILNLICVSVVQNDINMASFLYSINIAIFLSFYFIMRIPIHTKNEDKRIFFNYFLFVFLISLIFSFIIQSGIGFSSAVVPKSKDIQAIFIDSFLNIPRSNSNYLYFFNDLIKEGSLFYELASFIYKQLPTCMLALACIEFRYRNNNRYYINSIFLAYIGSVIGLIIYFLYPITGPVYFERTMQQLFPSNYNWINYLGNELSGSLFPRNGMPSLHVGLALFIYLNSKGLNAYLRSFFALFLVGTICATVILGEHYIIDWIVSPSFVLVVMAICAIEIPLKNKKNIILINLSFIVIWYLFIWFGVDVLSKYFKCINCSNFSYSMTLTLYSFILSGFYIFFKTYKMYTDLTDIYMKNLSNINHINVAYEIKNLFKIKVKNFSISFLFILSGFAGLMYQVIFGKMLVSIFGSTSIAMSIVLATYMIGLSLGSYIGGKEKSNIDPLLRYAFCEIYIAIFCLFTPLFFWLIERVYYQLANFNNENLIYLSSIKIILGILALIVPTTIMGMTTPILLKHYNKTNKSSISLTHLYTLNTFGAALGALLSGYILIPQLGIRNSIFLTVAINLLIGIQAIKYFKKENQVVEKISFYVKNFILEIKSSFNFSISKKIITNKKIGIVLLLLFVSGVINMSLETLFIHALAIVVGNSSYAFSIMLFTFLIGLSLGGYIGKYLIINNITGYKVVMFLEILVGFSVFIGFNFLDLIPSYLASFSNSDIIKTFSQKEFIRTCVCFIVMIIPTISIGLVYSMLMESLFSNEKELENESLIGYGLAINTIGNIVGVFFGGLVLVNILGLSEGFKVISILAIIASIIIIYPFGNKKDYIFPVSFLCIFILIPFSLNMNKITSGANVYFQDLSRGKVVEFTESIDGGLTSVNKEIVNGKEILTLLTNGKFQGNNSGEIFAQGAFAVAPLMHLGNRDSALVIGYGTGMTTRVIHEASFKKIDIVDLSSDIIFMADKYFLDINKDVRKENNVKTIINDGRNYLKMTDKKYDFISMELTSIWFSGAAYLYNREFYKIAKEKLNKEGVLQQWVQLHHMRPQDFMVIINTVRSEFKYVNLYIIGGQGIIVATNEYESSSPKQKNIDIMNINKNLEEVKSFYGNDFSNLLKDRVLTDKQTDEIINYFYKGNQSKFYSTDDNLYLEYNTPKGNSLEVDTERQIHMILDKYK